MNSYSLVTDFTADSMSLRSLAEKPVVVVPSITFSPTGEIVKVSAVSEIIEFISSVKPALIIPIPQMANTPITIPIIERIVRNLFSFRFLTASERIIGE